VERCPSWSRLEHARRACRYCPPPATSNITPGRLEHSQCVNAAPQMRGGVHKGSPKRRKCPAASSRHASERPIARLVCPAMQRRAMRETRARQPPTVPAARCYRLAKCAACRHVVQCLPGCPACPNPAAGRGRTCCCRRVRQRVTTGVTPHSFTRTRVRVRRAEECQQYVIPLRPAVR